MVHPRRSGKAQVLDSDGVAGIVAFDAARQPGSSVLVTFDDGRQVRVPEEMLHPRDDGSYFLPVSLREVEDGHVSLRNKVGEEVGDVDSAVDTVIPVLQEEAVIRTREVETGRVLIQKQVVSTDQSVDLPVVQERVQIERVPMERILDEPRSAYYDGDTLVIPFMEEELIVEKRLVLREEVRVSKVRETTQHQETVTLNSEKVTVERQDAHSEEASH